MPCPTSGARRLAEERGVQVREYDIIYNLTNDIKAALEGKLKPQTGRSPGSGRCSRDVQDQPRRHDCRLLRNARHDRAVSQGA
jgi:translation initiation factor IF-2